jgi:hypothetical protein
MLGVRGAAPAAATPKAAAKAVMGKNYAPGNLGFADDEDYPGFVQGGY